jgi:hypothetical protein
MILTIELYEELDDHKQDGLAVSVQIAVVSF